MERAQIWKGWLRRGANVGQAAKKGGKKCQGCPKILFKDAGQGYALLQNSSISLFILALALLTLIPDSVYKPQDYQTSPTLPTASRYYGLPTNHAV